MKTRKSLLNVLKASGEMEKRFLLLCGIVGVLAGILAVAFRVAIEKTFAIAWAVGGSLGEENRFWLMPLIPALGGLVVGICIATFAPSASGSGIPQTKACYYNNFGIFRWRDVVYRFCLGTIFCGFGNSAGREGPTVHLCSAAASSLAQTMGFPKQKVRNAIPAGMGAGIAASFNAPLSAISFVFEELLGGFGAARRNGGLIIAVVIAAAVARIILGENPVLPIGVTEFHTGWWMLLALPIAAASGLVGEFFLWFLLKLRGFMRAVRVPIWVLAPTGGLIVGCMAMFAFSQTGYNSVFSVGYGVLLPAFGGDVGLKAMVMLFAFKLLATITNYSMGGSGGLFSPTLLIGGMLGGAMGTAACAVMPLEPSCIGACVLLGMGACFASIIRCPITSILMIFELTLNYSMILPLIAANLISYAIAKKMHPTGLYDSLLLQDGVNLRRLESAKNARDWANIPCAAIMTFRPTTLRAEDTLGAALEFIKSRALTYAAYPVLDSSGRFVGIASADSLRGSPASVLCADIAQRNPSKTSLFVDSSISEAASFFVEQDVTTVAVFDRLHPHAPVGILTLHDIARYAGGL